MRLAGIMEFLGKCQGLRLKWPFTGFWKDPDSRGVNWTSRSANPCSMIVVYKLSFLDRMVKSLTQNPLGILLLPISFDLSGLERGKPISWHITRWLPRVRFQMRSLFLLSLRYVFILS